MGKLSADGGGRAAGGFAVSRAGSRGGSRLLSTRGAGLGLASTGTSLAASDEKTRKKSRQPPMAKALSPPPPTPDQKDEHHLDVVRGLFKPYKGDLFGNSGKDNTQGMLYLSRMDPSRDPKKTRLETSEELKRRSLAQLGVKEGEDVVAMEEAHRAAGEERRRRLAISLATLASKPDKRENVVANGGVAALTKLSRSEESRTRSSCAQVFNSLATEKSLRRRMMEQGAAPAIIALAASSHNRSLRRECVEALCKLAVLPGSEAQILAEGGVSCLLAVQRAVPALGEVCLKTLINLSCSSGPSDVKVDELNDAALQLASTVEEDEGLEMLLIQLLCNLSGFKNNQQKLVEDGAIRIIARAAERTTSVDVVRLCASTLCNFASDGRARPKMSDSRTAQALLDLTKHENLGVRREVAHTMARLAADASCREKILQYGMIPILVTMSTAPDVDTTTGRYIALAFRVLSSDFKFAAIIVDGGAVDALISLTRSADKACRLSCAQSLCNLIRFAIRLDYLIECGVVSALVRLADPGDETTSECCAAALYLFFCHPAVLALIDGREVIRALLDLCSVGTTSIRKRCVAAIWNMTNVEQVAQGGGSAAESIPMLLGLLQTESDRELKADCAAALYNLARNQTNCQAMIVSGAVRPIIVLANSGSFETKTQCMSILQRMLGRAMPEEIMTRSFVRTLLDMSKMEHRDTQQRVVIAVYRISCCKRGRELLLEEGAPESLIRLISKPNEEMRKGCANTLLNLASDPGREMEITRRGAVSVLLITALVASDSDETRHACTKAMTNLLCEKQAHRGMFKDGVVWGLATMSRSKDVTIARLCSVALCNLSCEYWKDIATSNCMQAVYGLARSDDEAVMAPGMKALHNVLLRAQHMEGMDHIFSSTVPLARRALEHESKDIRLVGLRLTHIVSTTAVSRQTAMRYGLLERINVNDFDSDEPLCYAFCCALDRFALDPATRSSVVDSGCITNFPVLCAVSARIFGRLARFIYSVSCSPEHVPRLVFEHDCVKVVAAVLEPDEGDGRGSLDGARDTCAALLFNLSTQDEVKTELVLKGATRLASALAEGATPEARRNCSLVACNLAVGKVNTAKMVRHGAGPLLVELVASTDPDKDADVRKRASAAFRNLLCVSGNHVQLAGEGVIPALIELAKTECSVVRRNCASAMRSMTCKADVRQLLIASGAIKVILDDATNQDADENLAIDNELLCQIEAESWVNGTRGILVESRAPPLPRLEQNCSLLPPTIDDRGTRAAAALEEQGEDALYSMPWQKLQALDVTLREPDMEMSTQQAGANRFDDPGVAGALAGDADLEGPGGVQASLRVKCGKLEPEERSEAGRPAHLNKSGTGKSINTEASISTNNFPCLQGSEGLSSSSSGRRPPGRQLSSLAPTPEEDSESGDSDESDESDESDGTGVKTATNRTGRRKAPETDIDSATMTSSDSDESYSSGEGHNRGSAGRTSLSFYRAGSGRQLGDVEGLPDPAIVDWEVAVVMSSTNADDMVQRYIQTRKEIHPARRGSINMSTLSAPRRSSFLPPTGITTAAAATTTTTTVVAGGDSTASTAANARNRRSTIAPPGGGLPRRRSVQPVSRRASTLVRQPSSARVLPRSTGGALQNARPEDRRVSVPYAPAASGVGGKAAVASGAATAALLPRSSSKQLLPTKKNGSSGRVPLAEVANDRAKDEGVANTGGAAKAAARERGLSVSSTRSRDVPFDAGVRLPMANL